MSRRTLWVLVALLSLTAGLLSAAIVYLLLLRPPRPDPIIGTWEGFDGTRVTFLPNGTFVTASPEVLEPEKPTEPARSTEEFLGRVLAAPIVAALDPLAKHAQRMGRHLEGHWCRTGVRTVGLTMSFLGVTLTQIGEIAAAEDLLTVRGDSGDAIVFRRCAATQPTISVEARQH
jgi:hypothetical protein